ncbi:hypothetical protein DVH05_013702 [Phytophthora capsici]|nr:hypothetical protein DVH05_013702 [Phytophthora capsici]
MAPPLADFLPIPEERLPAYAVALVVLYLSLRPLFNVDRVLSKLWPSLLLLFAYFRYRLAVNMASQLPTSFLLEFWAELQQRAPEVEAVFSDTLLLVLVVTAISTTVATVRRVRYVSRKNLLNVVGGAVVDTLKQLPIVSTKMANEMRKIEGEVEHSLKGNDPLAGKMEKLHALPDKGMDDQKLLALMEDLAGKTNGRMGLCLGPSITERRSIWTC